MGQAGRFPGDTTRLRDAKLRHCAIGKPVVHAIHFLAEIEARNILTRSRNHTGKLVTWYGAATRFAVFVMCGRIPEQILRSHTGRKDLNQQFISPGSG